jgi:hypothetical protein
VAKGGLRLAERTTDQMFSGRATDMEVGVVSPIQTRSWPNNVVAFPNRAEREPSTPRPWRRRAAEPIDPPLAFVVFLSGGLLLAAARGFDPVRDQLDGTTPIWLLAVDTMVWAGVCVGGIGLVKFKTFGLWGSALAAGAAGVESALCAITGHHGFGLWWVGQIACLAAFGCVAAAAIRFSARQQPPRS